MLFTLINYNSYKEEKNRIEGERASLPANLKPFSNQLSLNIQTIEPIQIIDLLNNNNILNPQNLDDKIRISFSNFSYFGKIEDAFDWLKNNKRDPAEYISQSKKVKIYKEFLTNENIFPNKNSTEYNNFFINFSILHEIGHGIQDSLSNSNQLSSHPFPYCFYNFDIDTSNDQNNRIKVMQQKMNILVKENFADLFATIAISKIYNDSNIVNYLKNIQTTKKNNDIISKEKYHTHNNMESLIIELVSNNGSNFTSFNTIKDYIESQTQKELLTHLKTELEDIKQNNIYTFVRAIGHLHKMFSLTNNSSFGTTINILNNQLNLNLNASELKNLYSEELMWGEKIVKLSTNKSGKFIFNPKAMNQARESEKCNQSKKCNL